MLHVTSMSLTRDSPNQTVVGKMKMDGLNTYWTYLHGKAETEYCTYGGYDIPFAWGLQGLPAAGEHPCTMHFPNAVSKQGLLISWQSSRHYRGLWVLADDAEAIAQARELALAKAENI